MGKLTPRPTVQASPRSLPEQRQIDRVAHRVVAEIARVEVVAAVVDRQHPRRMRWVAQCFVEVDDRIECSAVADPGVDRLALGFALRSPGPGKERLVLVRCQGAPEDLDTARVGAYRELLQAGDHLLRRDLLLGLGPAITEI